MTITRKTEPEQEEVILHLLHPLVKQWFFKRFKSFSLPQLYAVNEIHARKNILVSAPTGATKTLTAFLSILNELVDSAEKGILENRVYCVYISPLKALNNDIKKNLIEPLQEIEKLAGKSLGIRVAVRTGDTTAYEKQKMLEHPPHIFITTPESLAINLASLKFREHLTNVQWLVVDEIHALAENKRGVHLSVSLERLQKISPGLTRVGLSATISPLEEIAKFLAGSERDTMENSQPRSCMIVDLQFLKQLDLEVISPVPDLIDTDHKNMHLALYNLIHKLIQEHKTTLIFTNTRSATERVVHLLKERFPHAYNDENIGAHHGSLSRDHRFDLEENLRKGKLKAVVCSTSLELGIDIGYIDLVLLLGSPKSVARALQRIGRSGHQLHAVTKGRIIVLNRDDLVECGVLLKAAIEKKIDSIHIPTNCLDVLVQHIHGMALEGDPIHKDAMYQLITQSFCFVNLTKQDFTQVLDYLTGKYISLEDRHIYAKIWHDEATSMIGKRGKLSRVMHMTNIGTIPEESGVIVKLGEKKLGIIEEAFLEKLKQNDIFVLGGNTYKFKFSRGMVAQVEDAIAKTPTVPSWFSEMLPLSFDLALEIGKFRRLMAEQFVGKKSKDEVVKFVHEYLYVDPNAAQAIYHYFEEQHRYAGVIPHDKLLLIEHYRDEYDNPFVIFHSLFGRRVNDCLSRAMAFAIARTQHRDVELGINDNGFYLGFSKKVQPLRAWKLLKPEELRKLMELAIDKTEVLKRRFRHCAARALMILRNYKGNIKRVGRQQVSSMILMSAVKRLGENFFILKEARREVLEDLMDIENTEKVLRWCQNQALHVKEISTTVPSPFAFNIILQGRLDVLKIEDKHEFLKRMHQHVKAKVALKEGKR